jgi:hypothetical protein
VLVQSSLGCGALGLCFKAPSQRSIRSRIFHYATLAVRRQQMLPATSPAGIKSYFSLIVLIPKYAWTLRAKQRHAHSTDELVTLIASSSPLQCSFSNFTLALKFASLNIHKLVIAFSSFMVEPHLSTIRFPLSGNGTNSTGSSDETAHDE